MLPSVVFRAGVDGSNVYFNKIPSGDVFIGNSNTRLGINTQSPVATIDLIQPFGIPSFSLNDEYGYTWHQKVSHVNVSGQGDGGMLEWYYGADAKGRFRYYDGQYVTFSDRRLKTNVQPLQNVLPSLSQLKPMLYEMKDDASHQKIYGFIAQEVKRLFPSLVKQVSYKPHNGEALCDLHTMNYSGFGVIAIKALQEQWQQIKELKKENAELMKRLDELEKKLSL